MHLPIWSAFPFALLLLAIATLPLFAHRFWDSNIRKAIVILFIALPILIFFLKMDPEALAHSLEEYVSFLFLLGSLFVISGGIYLSGDLRATPWVNTTFLALGAVLANLIGTTGASMVLIRAFLKTNSERRHTRHTAIFFIFVVSNCGGLLTPLGDPPLFLGYLRGVPFFWTLRLFPIWLVMIGALLTIFFIWDSLAYHRETPKDIKRDDQMIQPLRLEGAINFLFLAGVVVAVFIPNPWRELLMAAMTFLSIWFGPKHARKKNNFHWGPIIEVAIIFAGIFITMVPALHLLKTNGPRFGLNQPWHFFWLTGFLSSILDNAPTYLTFLSLAQGLGLPPEVVGIPVKFLAAISTGAVFMGANTYIGNGPNFMVKAIADHAGFKTPSFFGYALRALLILFPLYGILYLIFFR
jgi:Na+/H+ antiporter NhaD/arsenite permease-like protein